jgi:hypothetical protein
VEYTEVVIDGECGNTKELQRTWKATDCCGNSATATQIISVIDVTPPVLTIEPVDTHFECDETVIVPEVTATDDCQDADPEVPEPTTTESGD